MKNIYSLLKEININSWQDDCKLSSNTTEFDRQVNQLYSDLIGMRERLKWKNRLRREISAGEAYWLLNGESEKRVVDRLKRYDASSRIKQFFWRRFTNIEEQREMLVHAKALDVLVGIGNHAALLKGVDKEWLMSQKNHIQKKTELKKILVDIEQVCSQSTIDKEGNWSLLNRILEEQIVRLVHYRQQLLTYLYDRSRPGTNRGDFVIRALYVGNKDLRDRLINRWRKEVENYRRHNVIVRWFKRRYSQIELKVLLVLNEDTRALLQTLKRGEINWNDYQQKWKTIKREWGRMDRRFPGVKLLKEVDLSLKESLSMIASYLEARSGRAIILHQHSSFKRLLDLFGLDDDLEKSQQDLFRTNFKIDCSLFCIKYYQSVLKLFEVVESYRNKKLSFETWQETVLKNSLVQKLDKELEKQRNQLSKKYHPDRLRVDNKEWQGFFADIQKIYLAWQDMIKFVKNENRDVEESLISNIVVLHEQENKKGVQLYKERYECILEEVLRCYQQNLTRKESLLASIAQDKELRPVIEEGVRYEKKIIDLKEAKNQLQIKKMVSLKGQNEQLKKRLKETEELVMKTYNKSLDEIEVMLKEQTTINQTASPAQ